MRMEDDATVANNSWYDADDAVITTINMMDQVSPLSPGLRVRSPTSMIKNSDDDDEHVIVDIAKDIADDDELTVTLCFKKKLFGILSFVAVVVIGIISVAGLFYGEYIISSATTSSSSTQHTNELRGSNGVGNRNLDNSKITKDLPLVKGAR